MKNKLERFQKYYEEKIQFTLIRLMNNWIRVDRSRAKICEKVNYLTGSAGSYKVEIL